MTSDAAMFIFLAAAVVAVFMFCSIVVWVSTPARERQARERLALLKTLAESPNDNARQVLALLREEEGSRAERRRRQEQQGWIAGGLITMAVGVGLGLMLMILSTGPREDQGIWAIGLITFLVGCVLVGTGISIRRRGGQ